MIPDNDPALVAAQRFYGTHRAEHLERDCDRMVDRCSIHLLEIFPIAQASARMIATAALADLESVGAPGFIDIDRSTARMITLRDTESGAWHLITLPELFRLVRDRRQSAPAAG